MDEALEILWSYARREPLDSNGETVVPTINNSIAAIRIIMRLEGWGSEKIRLKPSENLKLGYVGEKRTTRDYRSRAGEQFTQCNTGNNNSCCRELVAGTDDSACNSLIGAEDSTLGRHELAARASMGNNDDDDNNYTSEALTCLAAPAPLERGLGERNLLSFTRYTLPSFLPAPFHLTYYEVLTRFAMGEIKKLMITMPPQHGKSEGATRRLPAFVLGQDPDKRIAIVSYNATKARKFNRELQRIMDDDRYYELFPQTLLAGQTSYQEQGKRSRNYARNADECEIVGYQGSFKTIGVGGSLTGEPVDMLIMDDLYKDAASAWSPVIRQNVADWYDTVASTRLHNDSQQLMVFTRWHMEDLAGRLLEQEGEYDPIDNPQGWTLISFPAIQNKPPSKLDPRAEGEPLWPERHSLSKLLEIKERTPTVFESMYQQNPQPSQGLMYEEFTCYTELPYRSQSVAYIDAADSGADYLCALFYKEAEEGNYIIDVLYTKEPMEVTETTLTYMLQQHQVERCHIESNNGGGLFVSNLQQRAYDMGNRLTRFYPFHQGQNKAARIFAASASVQKLIKMPLDWKKRFPKFARDLTGYLRVGTNAHDDAPDALTGSIECRQPQKKVDLAAMFGLR